MGVGRKRGAFHPLILKFDILLIENCFSLGFGVGKMKFHYCWALAPHGKKPSDDYGLVLPYSQA